MNRFVSFLKNRIEKPAEKVGIVAAEVGLAVAPIALPASAPIAGAVSGMIQKSITGDDMNQLEAFAITMVLGIINSVVKNPAHKAAVQSQLVGLATDIFGAYGMTPPAQATVASGTASPTA